MTERLPFHFSLSCIREGNGNPLQCPCLENPRDWGAWWAAVHGVAQSRTQLKRLSSSSRQKYFLIGWYWKMHFVSGVASASGRVHWEPIPSPSWAPTAVLTWDISHQLLPCFGPRVPVCLEYLSFSCCLMPLFNSVPLPAPSRVFLHHQTHWHTTPCGPNTATPVSARPVSQVGFPVALVVKSSVVNAGDTRNPRVWSLGREDPLKEGWQTTPVFLPGKFHGQRSLVGYSPWGLKESDMTEVT